jgi:PTS system galactosamine-specific IID component
MKKESKKEYKRVITDSDLNHMAFRTLLNQACFNYEKMQNIGFTAAFAPELKKIYKDDDKQLAAVLDDNLEFINTHNVLLAFLIGLMLSLYEKGESPETVRNIKVALFGPLAGIGDAIFWFTVMPIMSGICASLAEDGNILGPISYAIVFFCVFLLRFPLAHIGYSMGTKAFEVIEKNTKKINNAATIVGVTILGGLVASYVTLTLIPTYKDANGIEVSIQTAFIDHILPNLLPLLVTLGVYGLLKKKVNPTVIIVWIIVLSILGSLIGLV